MEIQATVTITYSVDAALTKEQIEKIVCEHLSTLDDASPMGFADGEFVFDTDMAPAVAQFHEDHCGFLSADIIEIKEEAELYAPGSSQ